jgi:diguanylate cyclase (GGDEF)-like protein
MSCDICGAVGADVTCEPSLVGGEVIGSVLVEHAGAPTDEDAARLRAAVTEAAPIVANLRNLELAERRAMTDTLTGLPNKRALDETLKRMAAQADRSGEPLAAVLFDLDHFKLVNDRLGHEAGDEVLAAVGVAVPLALRTSDFVGRFGGEEFLALLPGTGREGAIDVAEKLRAAIAAASPTGSERQVTASFGVAVLPDEARDGAELLRTADRALYTAKANGRDRVEVAAVA